eukprot:gene4893-8487_t
MSFSGILPKIPISIDDFKRTRGVEHYFLSHFHSDHYAGLASLTKQNLENEKLIFCSSITKKFITKKFKNIPCDKIKSLEVGTTIYNANHCPGSLMFLFETKNEKILYTGDFRFEIDSYKDLSIEKMLDELKNQKITKLYFDTTFCEAFYNSIPTRDSSINCIIKLIEEQPKDKKIAISNDILGSEAVLLSIAQNFKTKIFVDVKSLKARRIGKLKSLVFLDDIFTLNESKSRFTVTSYSKLVEMASDPFNDHYCIRSSTMWSKQDFKESIGVEVSSLSKIRSCNIHFVIYSMHASFEEIQGFIEQTDPKLIFSIRNPNVQLKMLKKLNKKGFEKRRILFTETPEKKQKVTIDERD